MAIDLFSIGRFTVHGYGLMIGLGFLAAVLVGGKLSKRRDLSDSDFTNLAMLVLVLGFLGGKILHIIVEFRAFLSDPIAILGSEGFVVYGGILSGIATIYGYCRIKKLVFIDYLDLFAASVPINQALGRIGCLLAGCCYGKRTESSFGLVFPEGAIAPAGVKLLPTQPLMAAGDFIMFVILVVLWLKFGKEYRGLETAGYLVLYSLGRFLVEFMRDDERGAVGLLTTSQFIAVFTFIAGVVLLIRVLKNKDRVKD